MIPTVISGEALVCMGYSEPDYGSDVASIVTRAVRDGDEFVINGAKMWTTMAHEAKWILLLTRILGVPLVAGLSFELIKFAGRNRGRGWVQPIIWPGMQLQKLTTREPEDEQVVVAIAALTAAVAA
jgi:alkylation response protein AidB-like acyl-CoA dehydrogenase